MTHLHLAIAVLPLVFPADNPPEVHALLYVAKPTNGREPAEWRQSVANTAVGNGGGGARRLPDRVLPDVKDAKARAAWIKEHVRVDVLGGTGAVCVWCDAGDLPTQAAVVNAVVDAFLEEERRMVIETLERRLTSKRQELDIGKGAERDRLRCEIDKLMQEIRDPPMPVVVLERAEAPGKR